MQSKYEKILAAILKQLKTKIKAVFSNHIK